MIEYITVDIPQHITMYTFKGQTCYRKYKPLPYYDSPTYTVESIATASIG